MMKVFAVFDVKAAAFGSPLFCSTVGIASRGFVDATQAPRSPMAQHPSDYSLFELGEYDPNTGKFANLDHPLPVISASQALQLLEQARAVAEPLLPGVDPKVPA